MGKSGIQGEIIGDVRLIQINGIVLQIVDGRCEVICRTAVGLHGWGNHFQLTDDGAAFNLIFMSAVAFRNAGKLREIGFHLLLKISKYGIGQLIESVR